MAVDKQQVMELLGSGLSNEVVASAVGCDPAYITQLMADENFREQVVSKRSASLQANTKRDRNIDALEDKILEKLDSAVDVTYKPNELLRMFAVVNAAKRRGVAAQDTIAPSKQVVNLTLPTQVVQNFIMNRHGEVIEAEGQTLVTMPASQLLSQLSNSGNGEKHDKYREVAGFIPTGEQREAEPQKRQRQPNPKNPLLNI